MQAFDIGLQGGEHRETRVVKSLLALPMLPAHLPRHPGLCHPTSSPRVSGPLPIFYRPLAEGQSGASEKDPRQVVCVGQRVFTHNDAEGWHRRLNCRACHAKLNIYHLIQLIHQDDRHHPVQVNTGNRPIKTFQYIYIILYVYHRSHLDINKNMVGPE